MHHKRHRPKHQRAGCLFCKPHKDERAPSSAKATLADRRAPRIEDWDGEAPLSPCESGECEACMLGAWQMDGAAFVDFHLDGKRVLAPAELDVARAKLRAAWGAKG